MGSDAEIKIVRQDDTILMTLSGSFSNEQVDDFQNRLTEVLERYPPRVILDLSACNYLTSMNLSVIFHFKKKFMNLGGDILVAGSNELIDRIFRKTNLDRVTRIFDSVEAAQAAYCV